jgi:hypothetical protein
LLHRPARSPSAERTKRYRARLKAGQGIAPVMFTNAIIGLLLDLHWLAEADSEDRERIGKAISRMLEDTAKNR